MFHDICLRYIGTYFNRVDRNEAIEHEQSHRLSVFSTKGEPLGKASVEILSFDDWKIAQPYIFK